MGAGGPDAEAVLAASEDCSRLGDDDDSRSGHLRRTGSPLDGDDGRFRLSRTAACLVEYHAAARGNAIHIACSG